MPHGTLVDMGSAALQPKMTAAQYIEWLQDQPIKYQYIDGEVFAMAGGSARHAYLCSQASSALASATRGRSCKAFGSELHLYIPATGNYFFADASVICGPVQLHAGSDAALNPSVVVEVLSPSTEQHDRSGKWHDYQSIPSLQDYLLVEQETARVEHYHRTGDGSWRYRVYTTGDRIPLTQDLEIAVDELYEGAFEIPLRADKT